MTPDRWARIDQLLDEALERPAAERSAFLDEACGADGALRGEVESLLAAYQQAGEKFLQRPALDVAALDVAARNRAMGGTRSLIGQTLSHYNIISVLGVGGMGEVYLARDAKLERKVALKLLPAQYTQDPARIKRFEREARAASALNHPNIITIYEIGEIEDKHFIAVEYVDGRTLRELLSDGPTPMKTAIEIGMQIASALAAAHEAGIIHRDIKPENIMLRRDGYIKVLDFGLVKLTEQERSAGQTNASEQDLARTNPGAVLGTVRYMSPEQAQGQEVDRRSDLFSLGILLYELTTGAQPFKGHSTAATLDAIVHHKEIPITDLRRELHRDLERIIGRALEKDRELRYQTADDLRADLKRLQRELDSSSSHTSGGSGDHGRLPVAAPQSRGFNRRARVAVAIALLVVLAAAGWRFLSGESIEPSPWISAYTSQITDYAGQESDPSLSPDGKLIYFVRTVAGQQDIFWQRIGGSIPANLTEDSKENDTQPACSPDGNRIVFRSERRGGGLFVMGATGESVRQVTEFGHNPAWSPDGKQIVFATEYVLDPKRRGAESKLWVAEVETGKKHLLPVPGDAAQPKWSPNGLRIAYYGRQSNINSDLWTIPAGGGEPVPVTRDPAFDWSPVWSPDGKYLYFASDRKSAASLWRVRIDEATGRTLGEPEVVTSTAAETLGMDLSRDGRRIVYITRQQRANIQSIGFDPAKRELIGEPVWVTQGTRPSGSPNVSPDGRWVTFHSLGAAQEDVWVVRSDGTGSQTNVTDDAYIDRLPRWSPDGRRLAFYSNISGKSQIWLVNSDGSDKRQMTDGERGCVYPFWSADGRNIGYNLLEGGTEILEVEKDRRQQTPVRLPLYNAAGEWFSGWSWSPDGKWIAGTVNGWRNNEIHRRDGMFLYSVETHGYKQVSTIGGRPEWLNDSRHLIFIYQDKVWLLDTQTQKTEVVISKPPYLISSAGISPDNRRIFYTATDHQADIYMLSLDK